MSFPNLTVAVFMGGRTVEHDISLQTGIEIVNALPKDRYTAIPVVITRQGRPLWSERVVGESDDKLTADQVSDILAHAPSTPSAWIHLEPSSERRVDAVFLGLHGPNGEDGTIQGALEILDLPYTGSGVLASALAMNKPLAKGLFRSAGLTVPAGVVLTSRQWREDPQRIRAGLEVRPGLPCIVKPASQGSSAGISLCTDTAMLEEAINRALELDPTVMVEEYLQGSELTCGVLEEVETREPQPLPVIEIVPKATEFFDYRAKYDPAITDEIVPAPLSSTLTRRAQEAAVKAHQVLGCTAFSRTDMILRGDELYVMELNTIPGLTPVSLFPKAVRAAGLSFPELLDRLVRLALADHDLRNWANGKHG